MSKFVFRRATEKDTHKLNHNSTPLWVKVFATIAIIASLLFLSQMLGKIFGMDSMNHNSTMDGMSGMSGMSGMDGMSGMTLDQSRHLPLWIEVSGCIALFVALIFFIAMLVGIGGNGRGRKLSKVSGIPTLLMSPPLRKITLITHIATSVGWIGVIVGFLALAIIELSSQDALLVRGTILSMDVIARFTIVPLSFASLITGLMLALFTKWGLLRHYWTLAKLMINVLASIIVLIYAQSLSSLADMAADSSVSGAEILSLRTPDSVLHSVLALLALLIATILSVYKSRGLTSYGQRKQDEQRRGITTGESVTDQAQENAQTPLLV